MGQEEVLNYLKESDKPLSVRQIAEAMEEHPNKISTRLRALLKWEEVDCFELDRLRAAEFLGVDRVNRRMRFFFHIKIKNKVNLDF